MDTNNLQSDQAFAIYQKVSNLIGMSDYSDQIIHYTKLDTLEKIIVSKELWLGNTAEMNDTSECNHFLDAIIENSSKLLGNYNLPELVAKVENLRASVRDNTYVTSWCEYFDTEPDGNLGMWRGYADDGSGIGLVIDSSALQPTKLTPQKLGFFIYTAKVDYIPKNKAVDVVNELFLQLESISHPMQNFIEIFNFVVMLMAKAPTVKHAGFHEEKEIRFLYMPEMRKLLEMTNLHGSIQSMDTQIGKRSFYSLPLLKYDSFGFDLRLETLLKKVIIGPSSDQNERAEKVRKILNLNNLHSVKVELCSIPYR